MDKAMHSEHDETECEFYLAEGATVFACECGNIEMGGNTFYPNEKLESLRSELQKLQQWKKEQMQVWGPVLDYMQKHPELSIGESISKRVLEFLKEREKLKELNAELVKCLTEIVPLAEDGYALHKRNGSHQEFLSEDRDRLNLVESLIKKSKPV